MAAAQRVFDLWAVRGLSTRYTFVDTLLTVICFQSKGKEKDL